MHTSDIKTVKTNKGMDQVVVQEGYINTKYQNKSNSMAKISSAYTTIHVIQQEIPSELYVSI